MPDDAIGYIVTQFFGRGMAPERADFEDKVKAEKAFTDAKNAAILWQSRPVSTGLGLIKLKERSRHRRRLFHLRARPSWPCQRRRQRRNLRFLRR